MNNDQGLSPEPSSPPTVEVPAGSASTTGEAPAASPIDSTSRRDMKTKRANGQLWLVGGTGAAIGLVAGVLIGQIEAPSPSTAVPVAAESAAIDEAVAECEVISVSGIRVGDEGQSISMQTEGAESAGAPYTDVACVLVALDVPDSVVSRIDSTRALDGRQNAEWDDYAASWGYHPDSGLDIVVEIINQN